MAGAELTSLLYTYAMARKRYAQLSAEYKGVLALIALTFGFGVIAITSKYLTLHYRLYQQLYLSVGAAFIFSLFIFPKTLTAKRIQKIPLKDWLIVLFRVFIGYVIGSALYREALTLTKISNVTFIQSIPFAAIYGFIFFREKVSVQKIQLLLAAYLGVVIIAVNDYSSVFSFGKGELFSLISTALFSLSYVSRKWMTDYLNDKEMTQVLLFAGTIILFIISLLAGEGLPVFKWGTLLIISVLLTGFLNTINIFFINYGFKHVKAVLAGNILTLESVFALVLAIIFYREIPSLKELLGGLIILGSVIQMNRVEGKES